MRIVKLVLASTFLAFALFFFFKIRVCFIDGSSMFPSLKHGDCCLVYLTKNVHRRDVVCFFHEGELFCKRVVGLPGETVWITPRGISILNKTWHHFQEPYNALEFEPGCAKIIKLGKNQFWVIGDNKPISYDSRDFGPIKEKDIWGKVIWVIGNAP
ncbi:MAG: signal peptidase I [Chlamydiae bacterium]|nr:MAG: signal peptidase I [Chlamydiota bacterium]